MNLKLTSSPTRSLEEPSGALGLQVASRPEKAAPSPALTWEQSLKALIRNYGAAICPDSIGYDNSASTGPKLAIPGVKSLGSSQFYRINPLRQGMVTVYSTYPQRRVIIGGVPLNAVDSATYIAGKNQISREAGFGYAKKFGQGSKTLSIFINGRAGDLSHLSRGERVSVQFGVTGSPELLRKVIDTLPESGRGKVIRDILNMVVDVTSAGGSRYGLVWRASFGVNESTGKAELDLFGQKIEVASLVQALKSADLVNLGHKSVARVNNEEAYLQGANPWQRTLDNRDRQGQYLNHGDPVSALAGRILSLQQELHPSAPPIRNEQQARSFVESLTTRLRWLTPEQIQQFRPLMGEDARQIQKDPHPLTTAQRQQVNVLLKDMYRYDVDLGSSAIARTLDEVGRSAHVAHAPIQDQRFTQDVLAGKFQAMAQPPSEIVGTLLSMVSWRLGFVLDVLKSQPVAKDDTYLYQGRVVSERGLATRMEAAGGVLHTLGLGLPPGRSMAQYKEDLVHMLAIRLAVSLKVKRIENNAQSLYDELMGMSPAQRQQLGRQLAQALQSRKSARP